MQKGLCHGEMWPLQILKQLICSWRNSETNKISLKRKKKQIKTKQIQKGIKEGQAGNHGPLYYLFPALIYSGPILYPALPELSLNKLDLVWHGAKSAASWSIAPFTSLGVWRPLHCHSHCFLMFSRCCCRSWLFPSAPTCFQFPQLQKPQNVFISTFTRPTNVYDVLMKCIFSCFPVTTVYTHTVIRLFLSFFHHITHLLHVPALVVVVLMWGQSNEANQLHIRLV